MKQLHLQSAHIRIVINILFACGLYISSDLSIRVQNRRGIQTHRLTYFRQWKQELIRIGRVFTYNCVIIN